jgi:hypothetical protein
MKTKKYWFLGGIVLTCLCVAILLAGTQPSKGIQWEYARYNATSFKLNSPLSSYSWGASTEHFFVIDGNASDLWRKAGFDFGNKQVLVEDWFNFLGEQGWELICIEEENQSALKNTTYWFKRHK